MTKTRIPVAELGAEDYRIVRHTHDVDLATRLMRAEILKEHGCPGGDTWDDHCPDFRGDDCLHDVRLGKPVQVWVRIVPALPNSWAASEELDYTFNPAEPASRGAFRAVEFR
jgi:hypothetical protein